MAGNTDALQNGAYQDKVTINSNDLLMPTQTVTIDLIIGVETIGPKTVDLILSAVSPPLHVIGNNATIQFTIQNMGSTRAEDVVFTYNLPVGSSWVSITASQGVCNNTTCNLGTLETASLSSVTLVIKPEQLGTLVSRANVRNSVTESNLVDNFVTLTATVVESLQSLYLPLIQR